jgi:Kef-type K+ transport system membrane component KefB
MTSAQLSAVFLLQVFSILAVCRRVGILARRVGQPQILGEMIAGVIMGPSLFRLLFKVLRFAPLSVGFWRTKTSYHKLAGSAICTSSVLCPGIGFKSLAQPRQPGSILEATSRFSTPVHHGAGPIAGDRRCGCVWLASSTATQSAR